MTLKTFWKAVVAFVLIVSTLCLFPARTSACGPFFTDALFVFTKHADFPLEQFASGKLGIVQPTWARSYLVVAYRTLSANPLSEREAKGMTSLWNKRLNLSDVEGSEAMPKSWTDTRKKVPGAPEMAEIQVY